MTGTFAVDPSGYATMLLDVQFDWCWWCGRNYNDAPLDWHAPFLIERAHVVNKPRVEDRRVVILLCSACHRASHDQDVVCAELAGPDLGQQLWLKRTFDRAFYDRDFLSRFHVGSLAKCRGTSCAASQAYFKRQGRYPSFPVSAGNRKRK